MKPGYIATHVAEEPHHWWFRGRRAVLRSVLRASLPRGGLRLVEIGCGTGLFLPVAAEFGEALGVEASPEFLEVARGRGFPVLAGALPDHLPLPPASCDVVLLLDVLEHIGDDRAALKAAADLLRPGGLVVCTVPAYAWLWSPHDDTLGHRRRYTVGSLSRLAREVDLLLRRATYFNTLLAPPIIAVRLLRRWRSHALPRGEAAAPAVRPEHDLVRPSPPLNALLAGIFSLEARLLGMTGLPFGISVLLVAQRR
jgi:SAM-dependent methyltransferase